MGKHVMDFTTTAEVFDKSGNLVQREQATSSMEVEGRLSLVLKNSHGDVTYECEKPMESFTVGFLEDFVSGHRVSVDNIQLGAGHGSNPKGDCIKIPWYTVLGSSNAPTYVQQIRPIASFTNFSNQSASISSSITSTTAAVGLESLTVETGSIRVVLSADRSITAGSGTIREVCLWGGNGKMIARDQVADAAWSVGTFVKVTWTLDFPLNSSRQMTMNWVKNFVQNISDAPFQDFTMLDGTEAVGVQGVSVGFCKKANMMGAAGEDDIGIVVGTSTSLGPTPGGDKSGVAAYQYNLNAPIANGTGSGELVYGAGTSTNDTTTTPKYLFLPRIKPTTGTATVSYTRTFENTSGAAITVKEAGIIAKTTVTTDGVATAGSYLVARWLTQDIYVADGNTLKITFQPQISATSEIHANTAANGIIVLDDAIRDDFPGLKNISMIEAHSNNIGTKTWPNALSYARGNTRGGYKDWRLPTSKGDQTTGTTINEIYEIYRAKARLAALATAQGVSSDINSNTNYFWSESEYNASNAWYVSFSNGNVYCYGKVNSAYVRCVR